MMNLVQLSFGLRNYEETVGGLYIIAVIAAIRAVPCEAPTDEIASRMLRWSMSRAEIYRPI